jgi:hypothetical protein
MERVLSWTGNAPRGDGCDILQSYAFVASLVGGADEGDPLGRPGSAKQRDNGRGSVLAKTVPNFPQFSLDFAPALVDAQAVIRMPARQMILAK